jgi:hypothetical protein
VTKARVCKVAGQERKPESERKCEGMNPHTAKELPIWELESQWSLSGLLNVQKAIAGVKTKWIEKFYIPLKRY